MLRFKTSLILIFFSLIFLGIASCSNPTETPTGSLTGTISLEGQSDFSGIVVAIYELAELDETIVEINNQYPQIGVHINQHTEFDHRLQSPVKSIETQIDGSFELEKIPTGKYNLVAIKDGWGFKYLYNVDISKGDNDLNQQINLYEEIHISGNIQGSVSVETDHHLIIDDDTDLVPGTNLTIHSGAVIRINPEADFSINSYLTAQGEEDNMFWITTNDGFSQENNTYNRDEMEKYNSMELSSLASVSDGLIEWGKWTMGNSELKIDQQDAMQIVNSAFSFSNSGLSMTGSSNSIISNLIASHSLNESYAGIYLTSSENIIIEKCIVLHNSLGIQIHTSNNSEIIDNYIAYCLDGIKNLVYSENTNIEYNEFLVEESAITNFGSCTAYIYYNNINSKIGVNNTLVQSYLMDAFSYINNNNFNCTQYAARTHVRFSGGITYLDATNNWWNTVNDEEIQALIWDRNDEDPLDPSYNLWQGYFNYLPYKNQEIISAGIR